METRIITLWYLDESEKAFLYSRIKTAPDAGVIIENQVWIPKSIVEHRTKLGNEHDVKLPEWFLDEKGL